MDAFLKSRVMKWASITLVLSLLSLYIWARVTDAPENLRDAIVAAMILMLVLNVVRSNATRQRQSDPSEAGR